MRAKYCGYFVDDLEGQETFGVFIVLDFPALCAHQTAFWNYDHIMIKGLSKSRKIGLVPPITIILTSLKLPFSSHRAGFNSNAQIPLVRFFWIGNKSTTIYNKTTTNRTVEYEQMRLPNTSSHLVYGHHFSTGCSSCCFSGGVFILPQRLRLLLYHYRYHLISAVSFFTRFFLSYSIHSTP